VCWIAAFVGLAGSVMSSSIAAMPVDGHDFTEMATPIAGNDHLIVELMSSPRPMPKRPPDGVVAMAALGRCEIDPEQRVAWKAY
jgi:hypothetical protein